MGKSKQKREKCSMPSPTGLPSVRQMEAQDEFETPCSTVSQTALNVLEKLQATSPEERECGCAMIGSLVAQTEVIPQLLQENVVKIMGPLFLDTCPDVRKNAVGALRNMSVDGGATVCEKMIEQDIMTPLVALMQQYNEEWQPQKLSGGLLDTKTDIFLNCLHLLWNLCENSSIALEICTRQMLSNKLLMCLKQDVYGTKLAVTAGQCLQVITEQNSSIYPQLHTEETLALLQHIANTPHESCDQLLLRTIIAGVLYNLKEEKVVSDIVSVFSEVLSQDVQGHLESLINLIHSKQGKLNEAASGDAKNQNGHEKQNVTLKQDLEEIQHLLSAQQMALEITSNMCCADDDEEEEGWEDVDSNDESIEEMAAEEDTVTEPTMQSNIGEIKEAFLSCELFMKVLEKSNLPPAGLCESLEQSEETKTLIQSLGTVQCRSLSCVGNMVSILDIGQLSVATLQETWLRLTQLASSTQAKLDMELLEAVTSAIRAVVHRLAEANSQNIQEMSLGDLQFLFSLIEGSTLDQVHANIVRIVSTVGCVLAKQKTPHPLLKDIALFLLEVCQRSGYLWIIAEALDAIFDVFAEDHLNSVIFEIDLIGHLKALSPGLKTKISQQKRHLGENFAIISTARTNLTRFIQYKNSKKS